MVVNHSRQTFVLAVNETTGPGESRGSVGGVEPCRAWAELVPLGPDWSVHMAPDPGAETDAQFEAFDRPPIATSADTPGRDPRIRIDVAADGTAHVTRDQPFPSDAEFSASAC